MALKILEQYGFEVNPFENILDPRFKTIWVDEFWNTFSKELDDSKSIGVSAPIGEGKSTFARASSQKRIRYSLQRKTS